MRMLPVYTINDIARRHGHYPDLPPGQHNHVNFDIKELHSFVEDLLTAAAAPEILQPASPQQRGEQIESLIELLATLVHFIPATEPALMADTQAMCHDLRSGIGILSSPVMFAFKHRDGSWHDASETEHSAGMKPLYDHSAAKVGEATIRQSDREVVRAYLIPHLLTFKNAVRTSCPPELQGDIEGTVGWEASTFCDFDSVTDKNGVVHNVVPLIAAPASLGDAKAVAPIDIGAIVNRFFCWKLPQTFSPDCGISFDGRKDDEWNKNKTWPIGTNLLTADEAKAMFLHCLATPVAQALPVVAEKGEK